MQNSFYIIHYCSLLFIQYKISMSKSQAKYWAGWNKDAANYFNVAPSTITLWQKAKGLTLDIIIKHNRLLDWITSELIVTHGVPTEEATRIVNKDRIGYDKCEE